MRVGIAAVLLGLASPSLAQNRVKILVMQYATAGGANNHPYLAETIANRISLLTSQLSGTTTSSAYLRQIRVVPLPSQTAGSDAMLLQRWNSQQALLMMWGRINPGPRAMVATSSLYLGNLAGPPLDKIEIAAIDLKAEKYAVIRDSHSFIVAYALLLDARKNRASREVVGKILAVLNNIYAKLSTGGYRPPEMLQIKASIDRIAAEVRQQR